VKSLTDWTSELRDFAETAGIIDNLDLVITVDTAVAHLAGAMGKAVWVLLPFVPDWRWLLNRDDSPWYPTMRLFRQQQIPDWNAPIKRIVEELTSLKIPTSHG
jgi:ADP-heptose:LPS heptosyltransferase